MYAGDGARCEDHACSHRLSSAGEEIQGSRQTRMNSPRQVLGRSFSHQLPVEVTDKLDRNATRLVSKDRAEDQTIVVSKVGGNHCWSECVDVRDRAAGHLDADKQTLF